MEIYMIVVSLAIAITLGFLTGVIVITYRETLLLWYHLKRQLAKACGHIPPLPTFFQIKDWVSIRKYKKEELPTLILQTRKGDDFAMAKRLKHAKNVNRGERGKYL